MRVLFIFHLFVVFLFANPIDVQERYLIDKTDTLTLKEIKQKQSNFQSIEKYSQGIVDKSFWIHLKISNSSSKKHIKRVYSKRSGIDFIDVHVVRKDKDIKTYSLGEMRDYNKRENIYRVSYFDLELEPFETADIYIKQKSYGTMDLRWHVEDEKSFDHYFEMQTIVYSAISGMLLVIILITFALFVFLKNSFYLIYALFTVGIILTQLSVLGIFYQLQVPIKLITFIEYPISIMTLFLLGVFPFYFFEFKVNEFKKTLITLKFLLGVMLTFAIVSLFYLIDIDILYIVKYYHIVGLLLIFLLLLLSVQAFVAQKRGSIFYLLSNIMQSLFVTSYFLVLIGQMKYCDYFYYTLATGFIGQDIFLGLALLQATYIMKKEHEKNNQLLDEYSKLTFIGQTMLNISHQWKTPINTIYNSINHIEVAKEFQDKNFITILDENLQNIKDTTLYLKNTAYGQLDFYKSNGQKEQINLYTEIEFMIKLIENEFSKKAINISLDFDKNITINIEKNYFLNILMILFENSYKLFEQRNIRDSFIKIDASITKDKLQLTFQDNAQGAKDDIAKIFDKDYSMSSSTGLGLYLAKEIVEHKLNATIQGENKDNGILFSINIPIHKV
jgi:signal transduction histidine kinase